MIDRVEPGRIAAEWAALWRCVPGASPFQHPAWLLPWWRAFGTGHPRVSVLRQGARLQGVLALYDLPQEAKTLPLGAGLTDYQDVLLAPDAAESAAADLLAAALADTDRPCHLTDLPPGAALRNATTPPGWTTRLVEADPCPVLAPIAVPTRQRRKLAMARHRAERAGGWRVRRDAGGLATLVALHQRRWQDAGADGVLADLRVARFLGDALPALSEAGLAEVVTLDIAAVPAAAVLTLRSPGRLLLYLSGYDTARAFESPGTLLLGALLEEPGLAEAHFLRGAEPYKYAWGAVDRRNAHRLLERG